LIFLFLFSELKGCGCRAFTSDFLCAACDKHWEEHETFFETEKERKEKKLPFGTIIYFI
jgi:hypothetical protein